MRLHFAFEEYASGRTISSIVPLENGNGVTIRFSEDVIPERVWHELYDRYVANMDKPEITTTKGSFKKKVFEGCGIITSNSTDGQTYTAECPVLEGEEWRTLEGYGVDVSSYGRVRKTDTQKMVRQYDNKGYLSVSIRVNGKSRTIGVHRLVAIAFIPNPENKPEVDHVDTVRSHNVPSNLRWMWALENVVCNDTTFARLSSGIHKRFIILDAYKRDLAYCKKQGITYNPCAESLRKAKRLIGEDLAVS